MHTNVYCMQQVNNRDNYSRLRAWRLGLFAKDMQTVCLHSFGEYPRLNALEWAVWLLLLPRGRVAMSFRQKIGEIERDFSLYAL